LFESVIGAKEFRSLEFGRDFIEYQLEQSHVKEYLKDRVKDELTVPEFAENNIPKTLRKLGRLCGAAHSRVVAPQPNADCPKARTACVYDQCKTVYVGLEGTQDPAVAARSRTPATLETPVLGRTAGQRRGLIHIPPFVATRKLKRHTGLTTTASCAALPLSVCPQESGSRCL
jgi:hypothetical protein